MRKSIVVVLVSTLILIFGGLIIYSLIFADDKDVIEYEDLNKYTYSFVGKSEHFSFENGKVYFSDTEQNIVINKFKMDKQISGIKELEIKTTFNGIDWSSKTLNKNQNVKKFIQITQIGEWAKIQSYGENDAYESDAFVETNKEEFQKAIKISIKYCTKKECHTEDLQLVFTENK